MDKQLNMPALLIQIFPFQILQVLSALPVSNKTMLLESKVYNVVERWSSNILAIENHDCLPISNNNLITEVKKVKSSDTSDSENDSSVSHYLEESCTSSIIASDAEDSAIMNGKGNSIASLRSDEEGCDVVDLQNKSKQDELMNVAHTLLTKWKNLKVSFGIQFYFNYIKKYCSCSLCIIGSVVWSI